DLGHALAAVSFSAATLGWTVQLQTVAAEYVVWLLGLDPPAHPLEPEIPEALVWIQTVASKRPFALPTAESGLEWFGQPNQLSAGHQHWPLIDDVVAATEDANLTNHPDSGVTGQPPEPGTVDPPPVAAWPEPRPVPCLKPA